MNQAQLKTASSTLSKLHFGGEAVRANRCESVRLTPSAWRASARGARLAPTENPRNSARPVHREQELRRSLSRP